MRNEHIKTAKNSRIGKNFRESTGFPVVIMNSKLTISKWKTWSRGTNSRFPFVVNAMPHLSILETFKPRAICQKFINS